MRNKLTKIATAILLFAALHLFFSTNTAYAVIQTTTTNDGFEYYCDHSQHIATIVKYSGVQTEISFPSVLEDCKVTTIQSLKDNNSDTNYNAFRCVFEQPDKITKITVPDTVEEIGWNAFKDCVNLKSIELSNHLKKLGGTAFNGCNSLESIVLPSSITTLEGTNVSNVGETARYFGPFSDCKNLKEIIFTKGAVIDTIPDRCFYNCPNLKTVILPDGIKSIGSSAFIGCTSLTSIDIPDSVESICGNAFNGCSSLTSVLLGKNVTEIQGYAFAKTGIKTIQFPSSLHTIGNNAFDSCSSLSKVTGGKNVTTISRRAFKDCTSLTSYSFGKALIQIDAYAFYHTNLKYVVLPNTVSRIEIGVFNQCTNLKKMYILNNPQIGGFTTGIRTTLYGYKDSSVQEYAKIHNISFKPINRPTNVKATNISKSTTKVTFKKVSGINHYTIYRSTSKKGTYKKIGTISTNTFKDKSVKRGSTYYYYITMTYTDKDNLKITDIKSDITKLNVTL